MLLRTVFFLYITTNIQYTLAQPLIIDAGKDRILCVSSKGIIGPSYNNFYNGNDTLGGFPTIKSGVPPYKIKWETKYISGSTAFYASNFLNDTVLLNPKLLRWTQNLYFILTIEDGAGQKALDTINLKVYNFTYLTMNTFYKYAKDTILIYAPIVSLNPASNYIWNPPNFITSSTKEGTKTWTKTNFIYTVSMIDSFGCISDSIPININILKENSISQVNISNDIFSNYHNPIYDNSIFEINKNSKVKKIEILNSLGQKIYSQNHTESLAIGRHTKEKGVYFIALYNGDQRIGTVKIQKE